MEGSIGTREEGNAREEREGTIRQVILHNPGRVERVQYFDVLGIAVAEQVRRFGPADTLIRSRKAYGYMRSRTDKPETQGDRGIEEGTERDVRYAIGIREGIQEAVQEPVGHRRPFVSR